MTKVNFLRNVAIIFACLAVMTACNGGNKKNGAAQQLDNEKTAVTTAVTTAKSGGGDVATQVKSINANNWKAVVKVVFGIDVSLPDGWIVNDAKSLNETSDVRIEFTPGDKSEFADFGAKIFDLTKAVSKKQMQKSRGGGNVNSFEDTKSGSTIVSWKYFYGEESATNGVVTVIVSVEYDDTIVLQLD
jgi:hypothetical protein